MATRLLPTAAWPRGSTASAATAQESGTFASRPVEPSSIPPSSRRRERSRFAFSAIWRRPARESQTRSAGPAAGFFPIGRENLYGSMSCSSIAPRARIALKSITPPTGCDNPFAGPYLAPPATILTTPDRGRAIGKPVRAVTGTSTPRRNRIASPAICRSAGPRTPFTW